MIRTVALTLAAVLLLGWLGPALDDHSAERDEAAALEYLQRLDASRDRFERAAQRMCGPQAAWAEVGQGVIQCFTKRGRPVGRKARVYTEAL